MNETFRDVLEELERDFSEAGQKFPGLRLDLLMDNMGRPMTRKRWDAFVKSEGGGRSSSQTWDLFPDDQILARFRGNPKGEVKFQELAVRAHKLLCDTDPTLKQKDGYYGWLRVIYEIARNCPTSEVCYERKLWGHDDVEELGHEREGSGFRGTPFQAEFNQCLFCIATAVIRMFLSPHYTRFLRPHERMFPRLITYRSAAAQSAEPRRRGGDSQPAPTTSAYTSGSVATVRGVRQYFRA